MEQLNDSPSWEVTRNTLVQAFQDDLLASLVFPNKEERLEKLQKLFRLLLQVEKSISLEGWKATLLYTDSTDEHISGDDEIFLDELLAGASEAAVEKFTDFKVWMSELEQEETKGKPHISVSYLGVADELRGKGYGKRLLDEIKKVSDEKQLPIYLYTINPDTVDFYERNGFIQKSHRIESSTRIPYWTFMYVPQKSQSIGQHAKELVVDIL